MFVFHDFCTVLMFNAFHKNNVINRWPVEERLPSRGTKDMSREDGAVFSYWAQQRSPGLAVSFVQPLSREARFLKVVPPCCAHHTWSSQFVNGKYKTASRPLVRHYFLTGSRECLCVGSDVIRRASKRSAVGV